MARALRSPLLWIGLAVSAGALYLAFRGLRWTEVSEALGSANPGLLVLAVALMLVSLFVRAQRWAFLFRPQRGLRLSNLFGAMNAGYALNNVLPLRTGDFARAYLIGETEDVTAPRAFATVIVERILDTITVVVMLMITLPFIDAPAWAKWPTLLLGLGFLSLAVVLALLSTARARAAAIAAWAARLLPGRYQQRTQEAIEAVFEGLTVLRQPRALVPAAAWSVIAWFTSALFTFVVLRAFDLDLPMSAALFVTSAAALGMIVPSSPGYIGVFHAIAIESLVNVFDADRSRAASYALVQHAIFYLTPILIGVVYLWRERHTWQQSSLLGSLQTRREQKVQT